MAQIVSNVFNFVPIEEDKIEKLEINKSEVIYDIKSEYINPGKTLLDELKPILHSCKGYEGVVFEEVVLNKSNFQDNHYDLMNNRYLVVMYSETKNEYKYLTLSGKVYITSDSNIINIIHNIPKPIKITCTYVPVQKDEKIFSLSLFSRLFFNIYTEDTCTLIRHYIKPTVTLNTDNEYSILYYMFSIYPRLEHLINTHKYFKYIYLEQYVYNVSKKAVRYQEMNSEALSIVKDRYVKELSNLLRESGIDLSAVKSKMSLLEYIDNHSELNLYPTINKRILNLLEYNKMADIIKHIDCITLIDYLQEYKKYPDINTVSKLGDISKGIDIPMNFSSNRALIKGSYNDMFFKLLADITHNKEFIKLSSKGPLIYQLIKDTVNDMQELYACYCEYYILALSSGCKSDEEILTYFKNNLYTLLSEEDLRSIKDIYNKELSNLKDAIDKYNNILCYNDTPKLLNHQELDAISVAIYDRKRLIMKNLIQELDLYFSDFNQRNKVKINIVYFDSDNVYLLADEEALNTAFDTLTRVMPSIFNTYSRVSPTCYVEVLDVEKEMT